MVVLSANVAHCSLCLNGLVNILVDAMRFSFIRLLSLCKPM